MTLFVTDNILKRIFLYEIWCIFIQISLKFVLNCPITNNPSMVQIMVGRLTVYWRIYASLCLEGSISLKSSLCLPMFFDPAELHQTCNDVAGVTVSVNSVSPRRCGNNYKSVITQNMKPIELVSTSCEITLRWLTHNTTNGMSTLVQVMAWWHQATSHYLSQCWPRSMSPSGFIRP